MMRKLKIWWCLLAFNVLTLFIGCGYFLIKGDTPSIIILLCVFIGTYAVANTLGFYSGKPEVVELDDLKVGLKFEITGRIKSDLGDDYYVICHRVIDEFSSFEFCLRCPSELILASNGTCEVVKTSDGNRLRFERVHVDRLSTAKPGRF